MKNSCHSDWTETLISKADIERTKTDQTTTYYKAIQSASSTGQPVGDEVANKSPVLFFFVAPVGARGLYVVWMHVFGGVATWIVCLCCVWRCVWGRPRGLYACVSSVPQALKRVIVWAQYQPGALTRQVAEILLVFQIVL